MANQAEEPAAFRLPSPFFEDGRFRAPRWSKNTVGAPVSLANDAASSCPRTPTIFPLPINLELLERGEERYKDFLHSLPRLAGPTETAMGGCAGHEASAPPIIKTVCARRPMAIFLRQHHQRVSARCWVTRPADSPRAESLGPSSPYIRRVCSSAATPSPPTSPAELREKLNQGGPLLAKKQGGEPKPAETGSTKGFYRRQLLMACAGISGARKSVRAAFNNGR